MYNYYMFENTNCTSEEREILSGWVKWKPDPTSTEFLLVFNDLSREAKEIAMSLLEFNPYLSVISLPVPYWIVSPMKNEERKEK